MSLKNVIGCNKGLCIAISSFVCSFILWGFGYTFTILFVHIQDDFKSSTTATGWVGSSYYGIASTLAVLVGPLVKRFKYRTTFLMGILLSGISLFVSSFVQSITAFFITYGFIYASGTCISYYVSLILVKMYYSNSPYITRATYFSTMGATFGFMVQSPIVGKLLTVVGWRGVLRIYSGITIVVGLLCSNFMHEPLNCEEREKRERSTSEETFLKHKDKHFGNKEECEESVWCMLTFPETWYFFIGMVITSTATMFCYINIVDFMNYIGISTYVSSWILMAAAGSELSGKTVFAMFGDRIPMAKMYLLAPTNILFAGMMIILIYTRTTGHMIAWIICLGFLKSVFHAMPWTATIELLGSHRNTQSTVLGSLGYGIGSFSGTIVSGLSYDHTGSYQLGLLIGCAMYIVGALFFQAAPFHQRIFAPERYLIDKKPALSVSDDEQFDYVVDSYITTV
ncbi:monocarboxylate transporter 10-like [Antedon mediterranea]|uniref:monocarboxylate transporter 10-like n=1 Tax=Antedon mediterranea TaxID=105859 RepID=UPI003AF4DBFC